MKTEQFLKGNGIEMTDFISSSTYDAIVKVVDKLRQAAVSGSLPHDDAWGRLQKCREYLMGVEPYKLTVEEALEAFGFGRDGRRQ